MRVSEEEFKVVLIGLTVGGLLAFALIGALVAIYDRIRATRDTKSLAQTFREWDA